jgi:hypothetical protein
MCDDVGVECTSAVGAWSASSRIGWCGSHQNSAIKCRRLVGTTVLKGGDMSCLWDGTCVGSIC